MAFFSFKKSFAHILRLCLFAGIMASGSAFGIVDVIGSWVNGTTHTAEAGSNRALLVFTYGESVSAFTTTAVTYGGQAMTKITEKAQNDGMCSYVSAWILNDAGITAASSSTIAVTWSTGPDASTIESVFLSGVNQSTLTGTSSSNGASPATNITSTALSNSSGDMAFVAGVAGVDGNYTVDSGFAKTYEASGLWWGDAVAGIKTVTGTNETPSLTLSSSQRQAIIGFVVKTSSVPKTWDGGGGSGSWTTDANWDGTYPTTGADIIFAGTSQLAVTHNNTAATSYGSFTFASGAGAFTLSGTSITLGGNIANNSANLQTLSVDIALSGARTVTTAGGSMKISGIISGGYGLTKAGSATLTLTNTQTYTGTTTISAGTLQIGDGTTDGSIATSSGITDNAALIYNVLGSRTYANVISGTGTLTKSGSGTLTLSGTNTYSGATTVSVGTLTAGIATSSFGSSSAVTTANTANTSIDISGFNTTIGSLAGGGTNGGDVILTGKTLTTGGNNTSTTYSGVLSGASGALTKTGNGTFTLAGTSTYTGATTVSNGTLLVTGATSSSSAVAVNSGGTLGGGTWATPGTIAGAITVNNGGTLAPGTGGTTIGKLTTGAVTFSTTSTYSVDLNGTTPTHDQINSTGTVALGSGTNTLTVASIANSSDGKIYTIITASSVTGTFAGLAEASTFVVSGRTLRINYTSTTVTLTDLAGSASVLGSWVNGTSHTKEAGTNRVFLVFVFGEYTGSFSVTGVTYGTQSLTKIVDVDYSDGIHTYSSAWVLNEAGVAAASTSTIAVTWSAGPTASTVESVFLSGVYQYAPIGSTASNGAGAVTNIKTAALSNNSRDIVFVAGAAGTDYNYTVDSGFTKQYEATGLGWGDAVVGNKFANGVNETPSLTLSAPERQTIIGFVVRDGTTTITWDGGGGNGSWILDANWVGDVPHPTGGEDIVFAGTVQTAVNHDYTAATSYNSLTFSSGAGAFTLSGNSITLGGSGDITNNDNDLQTISLNMALSGRTRTVTTASGDMAISGIVSGGYGLTKAGTATLTLSGTNTYSGATTVNAGTLKAGVSTAAFGSNTAVSVANSANTSLDIAGYNNTIGSLSGGGTTGGTVILTGNTLTTGGNNTNTTFSGVLSGTNGALTKTGSGTFTLTNTHTYTGATTISVGTLQIGDGTTDGSIAASSGITDNAALIYNVLGSRTYANVISGSGTVTKTGTGTLTLSGTNTYTGVTTVSVGTLKAGIATAAFGSNSAVSIANTANTTLDMTGYSNTIGSLSGGGTTGGNLILSNTATLTTGGNNASTTYSGVISGTGGALIKTGTGTFTLTNTQTYTGATTISNGTLQIGDGTTDGSIAASSGITNNSALIYNIIGSRTYANVISGSGTLTKSGSGTFTLTNTQTYTGTTTISAGTLQIGNGTTDGSIASSSGIIDNAALIYNINGSRTYANVISGTGTLTKSGTGTLTLSGTNTYSGTTTVSVGTLKAGIVTAAFGSNSAVTTANTANTSLDISGFNNTIGSLAGGGGNGGNVLLGAEVLTTGGNNTSTTYTGVISGTGGLTKVGSGTFTLSGTNTYTGATTVNVGTLKAGIATAAFGSNSAVTTANTANTSLNLNNHNNTIGSLSGGGGNGGNVILGSGVLTTGGLNTSTSYSGVISGTGGLTKTGSGTFTLSGTNTYTGATTVNVGTLKAGIATAAFGSNSAITTANTANTSLDITGFNNTIGSLAGGGGSGGTVILGAATLTTGGNNTSTSYAGDISGTGGVTKSGTGTFTLSGTNSYSGATTVSAGTLIVTGSTNASSTVSVSSGARIGGTGTIAGAVTVASGGTIAPGVSGAGTLNTGALTLGATSALNFDLAAPAGTNDKIVVTGALALGGTVTVTQLGGFTAGDYTLMTYTGALSGSLTLATLDGGYGGSIAASGGNVVLTVTGDPTPASQVSILGSWVNGTTHARETGSNRLLLVFASAENNGVFTCTGMTYGGQTMTRLCDTVSGTGYRNRISAYYLNEAGVAAATTSTIAVTYSSGPTTGPRVESVFLSGVRQSSPIGAKDSNANISSQTISTSALANVNGDMAFVAGVYDNDVTMSVTSGFTKDYEGNSSPFDEVMGHISCTGSPVTPSISASSGTGREAIIGFITRCNVVTWDGGGGTGTWTTSSNWLGDPPSPTGGEDIAFAGTVQTAVNHNYTAGTSYNSITFNSGADPFTLSGTSITLGGNIFNNSTSLQTINLDMALSGTRTVTTTNGNVTLGGVISGAYGLTKAGAGYSLTLAGTNTYTGVTTINNGSIKLGAAGDGTNTPLGTTAAGTVVNSGGTLDLNGWTLGTAEALTLKGTGGGNGALRNTAATAATYSGLVTLGSSATIDMNNGMLTLSNTSTITGSGYDLTVNCATSGAINSIIGTGTGSLTKTGSGTFTLTGSNTFTGATTISEGTLQIGDGTTDGSIATSSGIADNASLVFNVTGSRTNGAVISGSGTLTKSGSGTLILTGTHTFTGVTTVSTGTLQLGSGSTDGILSGTSGITNNAAIVFNSPSAKTYGMVISGTGTLTQQAGSNDLVLSGANTYTGVTTINGYTKPGATTTVLGTTDGGTVVNTGGTFDFAGWGIGGAEPFTLNGTGTAGGNGAMWNSGGTPVNYTGLITLGSSSTIKISAGALTISNTGTITGAGFDLTINCSTTGTLNSILGTGTGGLIKTGSGTFTLTNSNTYTGTTTISAGTLQIGNGTTDGSIATSSGIIDNAALIYNVIGSRTYSNVISGTGTLTKSGSGTLTLSGTNTYLGTTTINAGTLLVTGSTYSGAVDVGAAGTLGGTGKVNGAVSVADGGTIQPTISGTNGGTLTLANATGPAFTSGGNLYIRAPTAVLDKISLTANTAIFDPQNVDLIIDVTGLTGSVTGAVIVKVAKTSGGIANNDFKTVTIIGDASYSAVIHRNAQTITVDLTSTATDNEAFLPVTAAANAQKYDIYTSKWTLSFDETAGSVGHYGGIDSLSDDAAPAVNQLSTGQNLFYVDYNEETSKSVASGTWTVLESKGTMCQIMRQSVTLSGVPFIIDYTVHGSGKMFVRVKATNAGGAVSGTLRFVTERSVLATMAIATGHATPSLSDYVLLSSSATNQFDILLTPFDLWNATAFYNNASSGYAGYEKNDWTLGAGQTQEWNFMIDFSHKYWNNSSVVGRYVSEYRNPDSLGFLRGTPLMEQSWERALNGHWKLDETGASDTAFDNSGLGNGGTVTGGTFVAARWGNGLTLNGSQSVNCWNKPLLNGISTDGFTVMAWIKPTASINSTTIIGKHDGASSGWKLTGSNDKLAMVFNGNSTDIHGSATVGLGAWMHVAASCQVGGTVKFFINGILDSLCGASGTSVSANSANVILGGSFTGTLDDVRYYGRYIDDDDIKAIYNRSYRAGEGMTHLRADNGNSVHYYANGGTNNRRFPIIMIDNYWASSLPATGCVTFNGTKLTENTDYYAQLSTSERRLSIGLNKVVLTDSTLIFIDDLDSTGSRMVSPIRQMVWGKETSPKNWFWCKNFSGSSFGPAGSNQFYFAWKMDAATTSGAAARGGELSRYKSSEISPYFAADTSIDSNLVPTSAVSGGTPLGSHFFVYGASPTDTLSSTLTSGTPSYSVVESSSVRIVLLLNSRTIGATGGANTATMSTQWTIYPTGQVFRWDNISSWSIGSAPGEAWSGTMQRYAADASGLFVPRPQMRGVVYNTSKIHDNVMAFLGFKYSGGQISFPWSGSGDTIGFVNRNPVTTGQQFFHETAGASAGWNGLPVQMAFYYDFQRDDLGAGDAAAYRDAVSNGVQCLKPSSEPEVLGIISAGSIVKNRAGDLNGDGFNESEGAYMIEAANNSVHFRLPANADTSRYYPVFHITNYLANQKPEYVTCYHPHSLGGAMPDTSVLIEGYDYNLYHNKTTHELVIQIDSVFRDSAIFWISADRTLAVTMSRLNANGGDRCDTIRWRTESEQENLGYYIYRRIKPSFMDSLIRSVNPARGDTGLDEVAQLFKRKTIVSADTGWKILNGDIIPSASPGASQGPLEYRQIDSWNVFNEVVYEYKVVAVDYQNRSDEYGPAEARPRGVRPLAFLLWNNYPNPFRRITNIRFDLPVTSRVTLNVYNLQGRLIKRLIRPDRKYPAGCHRVAWDATNDLNQPVATGPYIYHIVTDKKFVKAKVMMMVR